MDSLYDFRFLTVFTCYFSFGTEIISQTTILSKKNNFKNLDRYDILNSLNTALSNNPRIILLLLNATPSF
jgi:hypothetical protein